MNANAAKVKRGLWLTNADPVLRVVKDSTMKAIQLSGTSALSNLRITDVPVPAPAKGEIRIRTEAYAYIPGTDNFAGIAGAIDAMGVGVTGFARGGKIFGITEGGFCTQYAVLKAEQAAPIASDIQLEQAAALAVPTVMAQVLLTEVGRLRWGQRLLLRNTNGDVAKYILQVAKGMGIHVTATSGREHISTLQALGADRYLDDSDGDFLESLADMVLKFAANGSIAEVRFPKHRISLPAVAAITWQKVTRAGLLTGNDLIAQGILKPLPLQQVSWKNPAQIQASLRKLQTGQLILIAD